jgi:hypothetical protein
MKKTLFYLLLSITCIGFSALKAQNWVNGGNVLAANGTLGTNSNHSLIFETVNVPRGILTNTGRWNLGATTTPAAKVQITYDGIAGDPQLLLYEPANDYARLYFKNINTTAYFGIAASPASSSASARLNFLYSGVGDIMTILGNKRVGIGTTSPATTLHVVGNTYITGNLGIGTATPIYKLHVEGGTGTAVYGNSSNYTPSVYGYNTYSGGTGVQGQSPYIGVYGYAGGYGLYGIATNAGGYGVYAVNNSGATSSGIGVYGSSSWIGVDGRGNLFGIRGNVTGPSAYAVGGISSQSVGVYGYTGNASSYAGSFIGRVNATGGYSGPSDRKLKQNIKDPGSAIDIINKLQPKAYEYRQDGAYQLMNLPKGQRYGFIAQDVEQVLPNLVEEAEFNTARAPQSEEASAQQRKEEIISYKSLNYTELIPIMVKAMQEQDAENKALKEEVAELRKMVLELKNGALNNGSDLSSAYLQQSTPNPTSTSALIRYYIPQNITAANIVFTDIKGAIIKSITVSNKGTGQLTINTAAWNAGTYTYTLYINGTQTDSRKLVIAR